MKLSVIFGTYNRLPLLQACVESIRRAVKHVEYEIVVCDGGSTDGSRQWLIEQPDVVTIADTKLTGGVIAFNNCFRVSRGEYVATLNDDCEVLDDGLALGVEILDTEPDVGQLAFAHKQCGWPDWRVYPISMKYVYANFGMIRREVAEDVAAITGGLWSSVYYTYAADSELSIWVHRLGWSVRRTMECRIIDHEHVDDLRVANHANDKASIDSALFVQRWDWHRGGVNEYIEPFGPVPEVTPEEIERLLRYEELRRDGKAGPPIQL